MSRGKKADNLYLLFYTGGKGFSFVSYKTIQEVNNMARMYSRKKGKSRSVKPSSKVIPSWVRYKAVEVELLVTKLAKEGKTPSETGLFLKDSYGIPSVKQIANKTITQILAEKKLAKEIPEDLMSLIKKSVMLKKHIEHNKHDESSIRGLTLTESKIKRLVKYYKRNKKIPMDWKYDPERIKLFIE